MKIFPGYLPYEEENEISPGSINLAVDLFRSYLSVGNLPNSVTVPLNFRVSPALAHFIEITAKRSGNTKTAVVTSLIQAGIQVVWEKLSDEDKEDFLRDYETFMDLSDLGKD